MTKTYIADKETQDAIKVDTDIIMKRMGTEASLREAIEILKIIAKNNLSQFQSYKDVQNIVRSGLASSFFEIGDQIVTPYAIENGSTYDAPWDIKHIAEDGVYLSMHYALPEDMQFDAPEAIYYAPDGLEAGTYNITIGSNYGDGWVSGNSFQFTLANHVPAGGQIFINFGTSYANNPANGRTVTVYDGVGTTNVVETTTTSAGSDGTNLGTIGAVNANRTNGNLNAISRTVYGDGRYSNSAIRQWLNSEEPANMWWHPTNNWDRPPRSADLARAGFLTRLPEDFVAVLDSTDVVVAMNTQEGFESDREIVHDKIFLPSLQNLYINPQLAGAEEPDWDYYKILAKEAGLPGKFQWYKTYEVLKHYNLASVGSTPSSAYVWLRSCHRNNASYSWYVNSDGLVSNGAAYYTFRSCPACKIKTSQ